MREVERGQTGKGPSTSSAVSAPLPLQKVAGNYRGSHKLQPAHQRVAGSTPPITRAKEGSTPIRPEGACRYHMSTVKHTTQSRPTYHIHQESKGAYIYLTRHSECWKNVTYVEYERLSKPFAQNMLLHPMLCFSIVFLCKHVLDECLWPVCVCDMAMPCKNKIKKVLLTQNKRS